VKHYKVKQYTRQAGMTLIELTVVLLVLIGLAGLLLPYVGGFMSKTHDSTGTNNQASLDNTIQRFQGSNMKLPNNMEALINGVPGTASATDATCQTALIDTAYCKLMYTGFFVPVQLAAPRLASLNSAGITSLYYNNPDTANATFLSTLPTPTTLAAASWVAGVGTHTFATIEEHLAYTFQRPVSNFDSTCYDYVAFGIGEGSELTGKAMSTAPVHFASQGGMGPVNKYNRFVGVFQVDKLAAASAPAAVGTTGINSKGCNAGTEAAKFIGSAMSMGQMSGGLWGLAQSQSHSYENIAAGN
jgi:type II secretory pathway pseudopilin PulG